MNEISLKPRDYQTSILNTAKEKNTLVILPTGTGKTLIAIMLAIERFKKYPLQKILILAPTKPLIEQHINSFKKVLPEDWADMQLFTGKTKSDQRKRIWKTAEFIFSTPQCIANDLKKKLYDLEEVSLLIVDEAHRCMKNYAYNIVTKIYRIQAQNPRILALTASPGGDKKTIKEVCDNLSIESVEIRTRDSPDVKKYLQELDFEKIEVDFPKEFLEIKMLLEEIYSEKIKQLKERKLIFGPTNKIQILKLQSRLMQELKNSKDGNKMQGVSLCAQALKISHAIDLIETQTLTSFIEYIKGLFKQASEKQSRAVQQITKDQRFTKAYSLSLTISKEHPKLEELKKQITSKISENPTSKIIIFAQFRETVNKINQELNKIPNIKSEIFVGQAIKQNSYGESTGLKQKEQKQIIEDFKEGKLNVLISTSIGEEGLDIPEVSMVIFYEPVPSAIRKIQRAGRTARLNPGELKILITKNTKDQIYHYASFNKEKKMHNAIGEIQKEMFNKEKQTQKTLF